MVECDLHTTKLKQGLDRTLLLDKIIEQTAHAVSKDTLAVFSADHSFDTQLRRGARGEPLLPPEGTEGQADAKPTIRVDGRHTGEEVLVIAQGQGEERAKGFFPNTRLFHIMMAAYD